MTDETTDEPRAIVRAFARAMERKLAANDATKGGWRAMHYLDLLFALGEEKQELWRAMTDWRAASIDVEHEPTEANKALLERMRVNVLLEAADVANYAALAADLVGALPPTDERGR